jgi:hypothetical protein
MKQIISEEIYKKIDEERIKKALEDGNRNDAFVLFKYSVLTKEEFSNLHQQHTYYDAFDKQMKDYLKKTEMEQIEKAFRNHQDKDAEVLFKFSNHLTEKDFNEIKRKWRVPKKEKTKTQVSIEPIWEQILNIISTKISKPSFETWIKNLKGCWKENTVNIYCQNSFQKDWVEERYRQLLSNVIAEVCEKEYELNFILEERNESSES